MPGIISGLYSTLVKRNAVFLSTIFVGAFVTNIAYDMTSNKVWDAMNRGRQWKDIKHKYMHEVEKEDDDDDDDE